MAGPLQQRLMRNSQGKLVEAATEQTPQTINQLASQAGMQAPPTTPAGGGMIGASPDQQKMMGTPNQKANALRQSSDSITTLQEAKGDSRYRTEKTQSESSLATQAGTLQEKLSGAQGRVQQLIGGEMAKLAPAEPNTAPATSSINMQADQTGSGLINEINTLLRSGSKPEDPAVQAKLNELATSTGQPLKDLSAAVASGALSQFRDETGKLVAKAVTDTIGVEQLLTEMNTNKTELAGLLGVTEADVTAMSLTDLSNRLDMIQSGTGVQAVEEQKSSRLLGSAERSAMTEVGREMSTTGMATVDADLNRLAGEMDSAQVIQFGGREWNIRDLLNDDKLSQLITDYIEAPDSDASKALRNDSSAAGLISFIERNKKALTDAAAGFGAAATENTAIQTDNARMSQYGGSAVADPLMKALIPTWGTAQTSRYNKPALLNQIGSLQPNEQAAAVGGMNELYAAYPDQLVDLQTLTAEDLKALSGVGADGQTGWARLRSNLDIEKRLSTTNNIDDLIGVLFDGNASLADINSSLGDSNASEMMGYGKSPMSWMDSNADGKIDQADLGHLRTQSQGRVQGANSLSEIVAGNTVNPGASAQFTSPVTGQARELYDSLTKWLGRGTFTTSEAASEFDKYLTHLGRTDSYSTSDLPRLEALTAQNTPPGGGSIDPQTWKDVQNKAAAIIGWIKNPSTSPKSWNEANPLAGMFGDVKIDRPENKATPGVEPDRDYSEVDSGKSGRTSDSISLSDKISGKVKKASSKPKVSLSTIKRGIGGR